MLKMIWKRKRGKADKEVCIKKRKECKNLKERKRLEQNEKWINEVEADKIMSKFWKGINIRKNRVDIKKQTRSNGKDTLEVNTFRMRKKKKEGGRGKRKEKENRGA